MLADDLVMEGARASAATVLNQFSLNIPVSVPEGFKPEANIFGLTNKANLRDLIAATGLVTLLKLDSNRRFSARVTLKFDG